MSRISHHRMDRDLEDEVHLIFFADKKIVASILMADLYEAMSDGGQKAAQKLIINRLEDKLGSLTEEERQIALNP